MNIYTLTGGIAFVCLAYLHGLMFITLKTDGDIRERAREQSLKMYWVTGAVIILFMILTGVFTNAYTDRGTIIIPMYVVALLIYIALSRFIKREKEGFSFASTGIILLIVTASFFIALFPNVLISTIDPAYSISVYEAASGDYSLKVMTVVAVTLVPIVLAYTIWSYYVFRKRLTGKEHLEY